jgi:hypothetical protein
MPSFAERLGNRTEPKIHARTELKIGHFLSFEQGRHRIETMVPLPMVDVDHEIVLGFTMALSGVKDIFGFIQEDWYEPKRMAQKLDLCFHRFRHSVDYFKSSFLQTESKVSLQHAVVCSAFQDIMNESLAFHETTVKLTVCEASALMAMDSNGFSDPYCEIIVRHISTGKKVFASQDKTSIVHTSLNPRWNWSKEYHATPNNRTAFLY